MQWSFQLRARHWFILTVWLTGTLVAGAQTWIQWRPADGGNGHYFSLTTAATNWLAAQQQAESWGGHLATITSSNEQDFINRTFLAGQFAHLPLWIGLFDPGPPGTFRWKWRRAMDRIGFHTTNRFKWVTGEPISYTDWKEGEPNNASPGEYYTTINWEFSDSPPRGNPGDWNDTPLNGTSGYGGRCNGPYFGIVECDTDPAHLHRWGIIQYATCLGVLLIGVIVFLRARRRRHATTPQAPGALP